MKLFFRFYDGKFEYTESEFVYIGRNATIDPPIDYLNVNGSTYPLPLKGIVYIHFGKEAEEDAQQAIRALLPQTELDLVEYAKSLKVVNSTAPDETEVEQRTGERPETNLKGDVQSCKNCHYVHHEGVFYYCHHPDRLDELPIYDKAMTDLTPCDDWEAKA